MEPTPTSTLERTQAEIRDHDIAEINALRQENAGLREALKPFAALGDHYNKFDDASSRDDMTQLGEYISVAHVRIARALLAKARP